MRKHFLHYLNCWMNIKLKYLLFREINRKGGKTIMQEIPSFRLGINEIERMAVENDIEGLHEKKCPSENSSVRHNNFHI